MKNLCTKLVVASVGTMMTILLFILTVTGDASTRTPHLRYKNYLTNSYYHGSEVYLLDGEPSRYSSGKAPVGDSQILLLPKLAIHVKYTFATNDKAQAIEFLCHEIGAVEDAEIQRIEEEEDMSTIEVLIPRNKYPDALNQIVEKETSGIKLIDRFMQQQDVTTESIDVSARIDILRTAQARLQKLMEKADTVQDALAVQRELTNNMAELESLERRNKYLERKVETVKLTIMLRKLYEWETLGPSSSLDIFRNTFLKALEEQRSILRRFIEKLIFVIVVSFPFMLACCLLLIYFKQTLKTCFDSTYKLLCSIFGQVSNKMGIKCPGQDDDKGE